MAFASPSIKRVRERAALGAHEVAKTMANLEVLCSKAQPFHKAMDPELLKIATTGDKRSLDILLQQHFPSSVSREEIAIIVQKDAELLLGVTPAGSTVLHMVASRGHLELAKEICYRQRSLLEASNMMLDTPLHHAARAGHDVIISLIIKFAREGWVEARRVLTVTNMYKANALHEAAKHNHEKVATALIEEDAELASMLNDVGMSPLYLAIVTGSLNVAKALLQSSFWGRASPVSYAGPNEKTVLHAAALLSPEIIQDMLKWKPMLTKCADSSGRTPLHYAASDGRPEAVKILLEHDPSTAYLSDADGSCPIHLAAAVGNHSTVYQILQQCPETYKLLDRKGKNFLYVAFKKRELKVVKEIISKISDLKKLLNDRDNKGNTPLHTAVENIDEDSVYFLQQDRTIDINIINHDGFTPRDLAWAKNDPRNVTWTAGNCIAACLFLVNAQFGPRQFHTSKRITLSGEKVERKSSSVTKKMKKEKSSEMEKDWKISQSYVIASVLVATVTFAAGFTVPGGYISDDHPGGGTAVLAKEYAFRLFLVSDTFAFVFSTLATLLFASAAVVVDKRARRSRLFWAMNALWVAIAGMSIAFGMGIYVYLAPSRKRISILLCIVALGNPLLIILPSYRNMLLIWTTATRRERHRSKFSPTNWWRLVTVSSVIFLAASLVIDGALLIALLAML